MNDQGEQNDNNQAFGRSTATAPTRGVSHATGINVSIHLPEAFSIAVVSPNGDLFVPALGGPLVGGGAFEGDFFRSPYP